MRWWQKAFGSFYPYRSYFWRYRYRYSLGVAALIATSVLQLSIPWIIRGIVENLQAGEPYGPLVGLIVLTTLVLFGVRIVSRLFILNTSRLLEYDLMDVVYQKLQRLPMSFYLRQHTGDLMTRASADVRLIRSLSGFGILSLANLFFFLTLALLFMGSIDAALTLAALVPFVLLLAVVRVLGYRLRSATLRTQQALSRLSSLIQETLSGMAVVHAYRMEAVALRRFDRENDAYVRAALDQTRARALMMPFMSFTGGLAVLLVLYFGGTRVVDGRMGFGDFVAFQAYMGMLVGPTVMLGWTLSLFQRGLAAFDRLTELMQTPETLTDPPPERAERYASIALDGGVETRGLGYRFAAAAGKERRAALRDVTLRLEPGQRLGVVGPVGSGKSTLLRLLARHLEVEPGRLLYSGVDANDLTLSRVRSCTGYVPQDDFLFSTTLAENIAFGARGAPQSEIEAIARLVRIHDEILRFPDGYGAVVGERGLTLSGGQRQRVALARALLARPRILILDDALSKVDAETAAEILASLRAAASTTTTVIASHRVAAVQHADEILVLEDGMVAARGRHDELLESSSYYRDIAWRQRLQAELEAVQ
jgi:ATP-binding cassette, subfamily B, multidrug efflux pump